MMDEEAKTDPPEGKWINIQEEFEIKSWSDFLEVTREELLYAVQQAGTSSEAVRRYLRK